MPQAASLPLRIAPRRPFGEEAHERLRRSMAAGAPGPGAGLPEAERATSLAVGRPRPRPAALRGAGGA